MNFDHSVEAFVILVSHFSQAEVCTFAGMTWHEVADDGYVELPGDFRHLNVLVVGPKQGINYQFDAVEESIDGGRITAPAYSSSSLHWTCMDTIDPNFMKSLQQLLGSKGLQNALAQLGDY